ncbi:MAG: DUF92 domain-containing protein [Bacteroidetes bacterium QH_2_64_26]|nr:MAG: DUF92 domain-containing protein [Bacteroidetes bacterium QH_2_64_26]
MPGFYLFTREGTLVLAALAGLGGLVGIGEALRHWDVAARTTRRSVHAGVSLIVAATPFLFARPLPVYGLAVVFALLNAGTRSAEWWGSIHQARPRSWGTVALPLSVLPALAATWSVSPDRILALQTAYLILGLADPIASWVGERMTKRGGNRRDSTISGSLAFAGTAVVLTVFVLAAQTKWSVGRLGTAVIGTTLVATGVEAVCRRGWDNFFIVCAVVLVLVPLQAGALGVGQLAGGISLWAAFGGVAYGIGALDGRGAATGGLFAASLVGLGGWAWIMPGIVFFGLSSALTALSSERRSTAGEASPRRTQAQVLANGGIAWAALAVVAIAPEELSSVPIGGYAAFVGALSAAATDTWATELGTISGTPPWSLRSWCRVPVGMSGAVSLVGSGGAVLGATSVAGAAVLTGGALSGHAGRDAAFLVGAGLAGMLADSVAGAFLQAQYRSAAGHWVETPPTPEANPVRGWAGIGNNVVNLFGTAVGGLTALTGVLLFG